MIPSDAFSSCPYIRAFTVPASVESGRVVSSAVRTDTTGLVESRGDRCFWHCYNLKTVTFAEISHLKRIGECAFVGCKMRSITIPASVEEIDGSAFVDCPMMEIRIAPGSRNFMIERNILCTADRTVIVRCFGREREVIVPADVEVLGKS
jgi:hypothetical protein